MKRNKEPLLKVPVEGKKDAYATISKTIKKMNGLLYLVHKKTPDDKKCSPGQQVLHIKIGTEEENGQDTQSYRMKQSEQWITVIAKRYAAGGIDNYGFK